jgi:hypothetical protein
VIADVEEHVLEIDRIPRDAQGEDLSCAFAGYFLAVGVAVDEDRALGRNIALADEISTGVKLADADRQVEDSLAVVIAQRRIGLQLAQEEFERMGRLELNVDRLAPTGIGRERGSSLSRRKPETRGSAMSIQ